MASDIYEILAHDDPEYIRILYKVPYCFVIYEIKKVNNIPLQKRFNKQRQYRKLKLYFHGTKKDCVDSICQNGFDLSRAGTEHGSKHGPAIYFSKRLSFASKFCEHGAYKVVILAEVLVQNTKYGRPYRKISKKPEWIDTIYYRGQDVVMKFDSSQCYPKYVITLIDERRNALWYTALTAFERENGGLRLVSHELVQRKKYLSDNYSSPKLYEDLNFNDLQKQSSAALNTLQNLKTCERNIEESISGIEPPSKKFCSDTNICNTQDLNSNLAPQNVHFDNPQHTFGTKDLQHTSGSIEFRTNSGESLCNKLSDNINEKIGTLSEDSHQMLLEKSEFLERSDTNQTQPDNVDTNKRFDSDIKQILEKSDQDPLILTENETYEKESESAKTNSDTKDLTTKIEISDKDSQKLFESDTNQMQPVNIQGKSDINKRFDSHIGQIMEISDQNCVILTENDKCQKESNKSAKKNSDTKDLVKIIEISDEESVTLPDKNKCLSESDTNREILHEKLLKNIKENFCSNRGSNLSDQETFNVHSDIIESNSNTEDLKKMAEILDKNSLKSEKKYFQCEFDTNQIKSDIEKNSSTKNLCQIVNVSDQDTSLILTKQNEFISESDTNRLESGIHEANSEMFSSNTGQIIERSDQNYLILIKNEAITETSNKESQILSEKLESDTNWGTLCDKLNRHIKEKFSSNLLDWEHETNQTQSDITETNSDTSIMN